MDIRRGTDGWILEDAVGVKFFCIESVYERTRVEILLPPETSARQFAESFVSPQRGTALRRSGLSYVVDSSPRKHTVSLRMAVKGKQAEDCTIEAKLLAAFRGGPRERRKHRNRTRDGLTAMRRRLQFKVR